MEGLVVPDQDQLLRFLRRLKEVFDVCDEDADGFIRVEHLLDLGLQFGQGDEVRFGEGRTECGPAAPICSVKLKKKTKKKKLWFLSGILAAVDPRSF